MLFKNSGRLPGNGRRVSGERAFTLVEVIVGMSVLFIAAASIISATLVCMQLRQLNEEKALARNAAEQVFSAIRGMPSIIDAYNRFGGSGPEETFEVRGLQSLSTAEPVGRVIVWRLKSSLTNRVNPGQPDPGSALVMTQDDILEAQRAFSESYTTIMDSAANATGTAWDDYIDTNTDGLLDISDDPQLMAVTARIRWTSRSGQKTQYFSTVVGNR